MTDPLELESEETHDAIAMLRLEKLDKDLFRNRSSATEEQDDHLYGGQVMAHALASAMETVSERAIHSLHGYFLRAGNSRRRVIFQVERTRDGGNFSTRRVVALQDGTPIFHMECSFHKKEESPLDHQMPMPKNVPMPEDLLDLAALETHLANTPGVEGVRRLRRLRLIEMKPVDPSIFNTPSANGAHRFWVRIPSAASSNDMDLHLLLVAYLSDFWLAHAAWVRQPTLMTYDNPFVASLDHALWFHRPARADDWLLYEVDSPFAGNATGLARGLLYDRTGQLILSSVQEALFRLR
jgi:acyl-CoA thioesterase-2